MVLLFLSIFFFKPSPIYAKTYDFEITQEYDINYMNTNLNYVIASQKIIKEVKNDTYYFPEGSKISFNIYDLKANLSTTELEKERTFKKNSLTIKNSEGNFDYEIKDFENYFEVSIIQNKDVHQGNKFTAEIEYKTHEFIERNGNIFNIYMQYYNNSNHEDLLESYDKSSDTWTKFNYQSNLTVPTSLAKDLAFKQPYINSDTQNDSTIYSLKNEDIFKGQSMLQFGKTQYVNFRISIDSPKTDSITPESVSDLSELISTNIYELSLPREFNETGQKVLYKKVAPLPSKLKRNEQGNLVGVFETPANQNSEIIIEGYIITKMKNYNPDDLQITLNQYYLELDQDIKKDYLKADKFWQKDDPLIQETVENLNSEVNAESTTIYDLIKKDYDFVIDYLEYEHEKLESFEIERKGAVEALNTGSGVCMEYADLMIALLRAQGIPSRAAIGYGTNDILRSPESNDIIPHQWVQIWIPDYGWLSVDPTWGENTNRYYIGPSVEHVLWSTSNNLNSNVFPTKFLSADINKVNDVFESYNLDLKAVDSETYLADADKLFNLQDKVIDQKEISSEKEVDNSSEELELFIKTTWLGRLFVILTPTCVALLLLITVLIFFFNIIKKIKGI